MNLHKEKLYEKAVEAAIASRWDEAINLHEQIIDQDPEYIDSILGIAFAYLQKDDYKKSATYYRKALKIEPTNQIAKNNVEKAEILMKKSDKKIKIGAPKNTITADQFINIAGKTKITHLVHIGQADVLVNLEVGEEVFLQIKKRRVEVRTVNAEYIGALPDDISKRLIFFLEMKSTYVCYVKASTKNSVEIFIKEQFKTPKAQLYLSFPQNIQDDLKAMMHQAPASSDDDEQGANKDQEPHQEGSEESTDEDSPNEHASGETEQDSDYEEEQLEDHEEATDIETLAQAMEDEDEYIPGFHRVNEDDDE